MLNKKPWILASVVILIGVAAALLNRQPANSGNIIDIELPANSSEEYDAFSDPNVLWGSEEDCRWALEYPSGSIVVSSGLTNLMSKANEKDIVAFTVELMNMCEFRPVDVNCLLIPDSLETDDFLIERIEMFNKAEDMNCRLQLYNEARMYVEDRVVTEKYLSFYYSWKYSDAKWARSRFIEFGFIPVYDEKFINQGQESIDKLLTFVGATKDIQTLEKKITRNEIYLLRLTQIVYHDPFSVTT